QRTMNARRRKQAPRGVSSVCPRPRRALRYPLTHGLPIAVGVVNESVLRWHREVDDRLLRVRALGHEVRRRVPQPNDVPDFADVNVRVDGLGAGVDWATSLEILRRR